MSCRAATYCRRSPECDWDRERGGGGVRVHLLYRETVVGIQGREFMPRSDMCAKRVVVFVRVHFLGREVVAVHTRAPAPDSGRGRSCIPSGCCKRPAPAHTGINTLCTWIWFLGICGVETERGDLVGGCYDAGVGGGVVRHASPPVPVSGEHARV